MWLWQITPSSQFRWYFTKQNFVCNAPVFNSGEWISDQEEVRKQKRLITVELRQQSFESEIGYFRGWRIDSDLARCCQSIDQVEKVTDWSCKMLNHREMVINWTLYFTRPGSSDSTGSTGWSQPSTTHSGHKTVKDAALPRPEMLLARLFFRNTAKITAVAVYNHFSTQTHSQCVSFHWLPPKLARN